LVGLTASAGTLVDRMSVGQRQRLAIAAALVHGPELIFLDEPTAALDPQARRELWEVLRGIAIQGRTIIYTTHHMEEAEALCDRIALISKGTVVALDEPANLVRGLKAPTQVVVPCTQISANQARRLAGADVVTVDNGSVVIQTQAVGLVLGAIGQVPGITEVQTIAPNLEDVYLRLTRTEHGS
jgi:ABC-2 type transport system ATP-binding protein